MTERMTVYVEVMSPEDEVLYRLPVQPDLWTEDMTYVNEFYYTVFHALPKKPKRFYDMVLYRKVGDGQVRIFFEDVDPDAWDSSCCGMEEMMTVREGDVFVARMEEEQEEEEEDPADWLEQDELVPWE